MQKRFNITGNCFAEEHYMADISAKLAATVKMVAYGDYFVINRPRQYGKTTMLYHLAEALERDGEYLVFNISFEGLGDEVFQEESTFSRSFVRQLAKKSKREAFPDLNAWLKASADRVNNLGELSDLITELVEKIDRKIVVLIDEVDKSSNNQLFISFLGVLRHKYLDRRQTPTFYSVVLAGVHDVKTLKAKIRPDEEGKNNSPWNIAADFKVDLSLQPQEIKPMLEEYAATTGTRMDTSAIAETLFYYTSGYPFLVSKLCKMLDEDLMPAQQRRDWTSDDVQIAVNQLITEGNANFDSLIKNLESDTRLYDLVSRLLIEAETIPFVLSDPVINLGVLYGIFKTNNGLAIHNRIYVLPGSRLDIPKLLTRFQTFMREEYSKKDRDFLERNGRLVFLAFLKPILNGHGYSFKEPQTSEEKRLDVVITFHQHRYLVELKVWRGPKAHEEGLEQLADYLDRQGLDEGYLLIFDHKGIKTWQQESLTVGDKRVLAAWV
jgi:AAA-like domain